MSQWQVGLICQPLLPLLLPPPLSPLFPSHVYSLFSSSTTTPSSFQRPLPLLWCEASMLLFLIYNYPKLLSAPSPFTVVCRCYSSSSTTTPSSFQCPLPLLWCKALMLLSLYCGVRRRRTSTVTGAQGNDAQRIRARMRRARAQEATTDDDEGRVRWRRRRACEVAATSRICSLMACERWERRRQWAASAPSLFSQQRGPGATSACSRAGRRRECNSRPSRTA